MGSELYRKLDLILHDYPTIYRLLGGEFLHKQCKGRLKSFILTQLAQQSDNAILKHLGRWDNKLAQLSNFPGFDKLQKGLRNPKQAQYYETLTQIRTSVWFVQQRLLEEIEPELPHRAGSCDLLLSLKEQHIYCEVTSRRFREVNNNKTEDIEGQDEMNAVLRRLRDKARLQLPPNFPGILTLETGRAGFWRHDAKELAERLFSSTCQAARRHVILIMLWSLEGGTQIGEPPFWFLNRNSCFKDIGQALLKYLKQEDKTVECG